MVDVDVVGGRDDTRQTKAVAAVAVDDYCEDMDDDAAPLSIINIDTVGNDSVSASTSGRCCCWLSSHWLNFSPA